MFEQPVSYLMSSPVITCAPDSSTARCLADLEEHGISSMPVVDGDTIVGVVSRVDVLGVASGDDLADRDVASVMTSPAITVTESRSLEHACGAMVEAGVHRVYVASRGAVLGVVSTRDIMAVVAAAQLDTPIERVASSPVHTVKVTDTLESARARLDETGVTGLIVTDDDHAVGMFSRKQALEVRHLPGDTAVEDAMEAAVICLPERATLSRAARLANTMGVRRIVTVRMREMNGVISGLDFARYAAGNE